MDVRFWGPWKHYIMQLPWKYHSPVATLFRWEIGCLISMEGKKSYGSCTSCVLRVPTRTAHMSTHTTTDYSDFKHHSILLFFFKMVVSYFPSNVRLCSLICSSSSSNVKRVIDTLRWSLLVLKPSWAKTFCVLTTMIKLKHPPPSLFSLSVIVHYAKSAVGFLLYL